MENARHDDRHTGCRAVYCNALIGQYLYAARNGDLQRNRRFGSLCQLDRSFRRRPMPSLWLPLGVARRTVKGKLSHMVAGATFVP
jgi:hypothetical protein